MDETAAIIDGEEPPGVDDDTRRAVSGYRDAMTYVLQLTGPSSPDRPRMDASLLKSLHFIMVGHDLATHPGQWRPGAVWVRDGAGNPVYEAPDRDIVEPLIDEFITCVNDSPGEKRGRHYLPSESLRALELEVRAAQRARPPIDPYGTSVPRS